MTPTSVPSSGRSRVVLDTDTYNEVDDQFALAHLLLSPEQISLEAVYAAPFFNARSSSPADGMEKSYEEIGRVIEHVSPEKNPPVLRGSTGFMPGPNTSVESEAVADLIGRALDVAAGKLTVLGIAAATNLASALLLEPRIAENIEIVWLGGMAPYWPHTREFNLSQDLSAARVLLDHDVPLLVLPCLPVCSHLIVTVAELEKELAPFSKLGRYLTAIVEQYAGNPPGWSKVIWDISASAWLLVPESIKVETMPSPVLRDDLTWNPVPGQRREIRIAREVRRDLIFADFYAKMKANGARHRNNSPI